MSSPGETRSKLRLHVFEQPTVEPKPHDESGVYEEEKKRLYQCSTCMRLVD